MNTKQLRTFVIAALDDGHGINEWAFECLCELNVDNCLDDVFAMVECGMSRYYLPEDHGLV